MNTALPYAVTFGNVSIRDGFNSRERREKTKYRVYIAVARNGENLKVQQNRRKRVLKREKLSIAFSITRALADEKIQRGGDFLQYTMQGGKAAQ